MNRVAILSVSNKTELLPLAKALNEIYNYKIISSGGTAKAIEKAGIPVTKVANYTGAPELLNGRVKTLHPKIHGGILANRDDPDHISELKHQGIEQIDLVVVNLYPFQEVISNADVTFDDAIENIDIGGPTMLRAAAKNHSHVSVLTKPEQYSLFLEALKLGDGKINIELRRKLALEAFEHSAKYDLAISEWMQKQTSSDHSHWLKALPIKQTLRYGENPHQKAKWFGSNTKGWGSAKQLQGKELSTNNLLDLEAALNTVREFGYGNTSKKEAQEIAAVVVKHNNPCGVSISNTLPLAISRALEADPISAFGGIVALNEVVDEQSANQLVNCFLECIVAPGFDIEALRVLSKKPNLRILEIGKASLNNSSNEYYRSILGGVIVQELDDQLIDEKTWKVVTNKKPNDKEKNDLKFAWKVSRHVRSNAIVVASNCQTLGIGAGQMNRVGAAKIALESSKDKVKGSVLASDGFLPFDDTVKLAYEFGVKAIIQPGGSIKDIDSIDCCNELGISMIFTGKRHFLH